MFAPPFAGSHPTGQGDSVQLTVGGAPSSHRAPHTLHSPSPYVSSSSSSSSSRSPFPLPSHARHSTPSPPLPHAPFPSPPARYSTPSPPYPHASFPFPPARHPSPYLHNLDTKWTHVPGNTSHSGPHSQARVDYDRPSLIQHSFGKQRPCVSALLSLLLYTMLTMQ